MLIHEILTRHHRTLVTRAGVRAHRREGFALPGAGHFGAPVLLTPLANAMAGNEHDVHRLGALAARHGEEMGRLGYKIADVVHAYGDIRQALNELAQDLGLALPVPQLWHLDNLLEDSLACALTAFERAHAPSTRRAAASARTFDYALRHLVHVARLAIESARLDNDLDASLIAGPLGRAIHSLIVLIERHDGRELLARDFFTPPSPLFNTTFEAGIGRG